MSALLALQKANDARQEIADIRRRINAGELTMVDLLEDPPECLLGFTVLDVARMGYARSSSWRSTPGIERLGHLAVRDGINLCMPLGKASLRTRRWVAVHIQWHKEGGRPVVGDMA